MRKNDKQNDAEHGVYPPKTTFSEWVEKNLARKTPLSELIKAYEKTFSIRRSLRSYQRDIRKAPGVRIERREQIYASPTKISDIKTMVSPQNDKLHSAHNLRFSIGYKGAQPTDGEVKLWGRYRSGIQVIYELAPGLRLTAFSRRLLVVLRNPEGNTTSEQLIEARKEAYISVLRFAKARRLALDGSISKILGSHHVLENPKLNEEIQAQIGKYAEAIEARTGTLVNGDSSHPGKMEHQGGGASQLAGDKAALGFEYLLWNFPGDFARLAHLNAETSKQQAVYAENIKLHLQTEAETKAAIQELRDYIRELRDIKKAEK